MASNYVQPGDVVTLAAPYNRTTGQGAQVGSLFGVAVQTVLSTVNGEFHTEGVWELTKVGSQAWTQGQKVHWDDINKRCTTDSTAGILIGVATEAVASGAGDVLGKVRLNGVSPATAKGAQAAEADLAGTLTGTVDGTMVDVAATAAATAGGATPTAAQVDTGIATAVATIVTGVNVQNKEVLVKINAILAKLRTVGIIAP